MDMPRFLPCPALRRTGAWRRHQLVDSGDSRSSLPQSHPTHCSEGSTAARTPSDRTRGTSRWCGRITKGRSINRVLAVCWWSGRIPYVRYCSTLADYGPARSVVIMSGSSQSCIVTFDFPLALPAGISTTASHPPSEARRIQATCRARIDGSRRRAPVFTQRGSSSGLWPRRQGRHGPIDRASDTPRSFATPRTQFRFSRMAICMASSCPRVSVLFVPYDHQPRARGMMLRHGRPNTSRFRCGVGV